MKKKIIILVIVIIVIVTIYFLLQKETFTNRVLNLQDMNYFYLTHNNEIRKNHILNEFKNFNLIEVNPVPATIKNKADRNQSGATGFIKILDLACLYQDNNKLFQPFCIFEDDVIKNREFPSHLEIPNDTDLLYIGLTKFHWDAINFKHTMLYFDNIDDNFIRIYNMLTTHGIIVCSMRGLLSMQKCMLRDYHQKRPWDISLTLIQPYLNVYALKDPLVYQYGKIGGEEGHTKINFLHRNSSNTIPDEKINKTDVITKTMMNLPSNNFSC
jgi:hypothetical protein